MVSGNRSGGAVSVQILNGCDGSVVEGNEFGGGEIRYHGATGCRILDNLLAGSSPAGFSGMLLWGVEECLVSGNLIEGPRHLGVMLGSSGPLRGSHRNVVSSNVVRGSEIGLLILGGSGNRLSGNRVESVFVGAALYPSLDDPNGAHTRSDGNLVTGNVLEAGFAGIYAFSAFENVLEKNEIRGAWLGALEGAGEPITGPPNLYRENIFEGNRLFGLVAWGASPDLEANAFAGNGHDPGASPPGAAPLDEVLTALLGGLGGGVAFLPYDSRSPETLDDGDPANDFLAAPSIGGPGAENVFRDNADVDVYAFDARAADAASLPRHNVFEGGAPARVRQDWAGLVRVEDADGAPVEGAAVQVRDASGLAAGSFVTGPGGFAAPEADPARPQGRVPMEEGGPTPPWPRFTEYAVDAAGGVVRATPHRIVARKDGSSGTAIFSWDGVASDAGAPSGPGGRYQIARVRLGTGCADVEALRRVLAEASIGIEGIRGSLLAMLEALPALLHEVRALRGAAIPEADAARIEACAREIAAWEGIR